MKKYYYPKQESIPCYSLSRRVCLLAFEANVTEPMATCFQGKKDVHRTIGAMLYSSMVSNIDGELDKNNPFGSFQGQHFFSYKRNH